MAKLTLQVDGATREAETDDPPPLLCGSVDGRPPWETRPCASD
jgi:hypothetical protein